MTLSPGSTLAHYRLAQPIGQGGMGVVWRATDSTLGRDVAIKVLPEIFASDAERLARLEREARLLASLNHPHIASIYGFHSEGAVRFLAMEIVEGEDLSQRIGYGPIGQSEVLRIAHQIALALEHAHERGIVHRDLKPGNVKLTADGQVKVLDFGLAKALEDEPASGTDSPTMIEHSPTITGRMTGANILIGTAAYMAPEQARGRRADRRADIWAFGVVLMEMLTNRRLFEGETISDTLASVLKSELDWSSLPPETPQRIRRLLRRCLERDPMKRLRDIGEARITLEEAMSGAADESAAATAPKQGLLRPLAFAAGGLVVGALAIAIIGSATKPPANEPPLRRFHLSLPEGDKGQPLEPQLSPDGTKMVYLFGNKIWLQDLDALEPKPLVTEPGAHRPFWSPDGKFVGFLTGSRIMKVAVAGGGSQLVCDTRKSFSGGSGASWGPDDLIAFSHAESTGLQQVPARGGDPRLLLKPDSTESDFHEPHILPGGRGIVFGAHKLGAGVDNLSLWADGKRKTILTVPEHWLYDPVYSPTGHILYRRNAPSPGIWAVPFSLSRLEATGEPFLVAEDASFPSLSNEGTLGYYAGHSGDVTQLVWINRDGRGLGPIGDSKMNAGATVSVSPDGKRVARMEEESENNDIWIYDTARGTRSRLTFDPGMEAGAAWSPDGTTIAYIASPQGCSGLHCWKIVTRAANGTGGVDSIGSGAWPAFSPDGRYVTWSQFQANGARWDLMAVDLTGDRAPVLVLSGNPRIAGATIAPQGDYIAYMSIESGEWELYLTRFPSGEGKWQVSIAGGQWPQWNAAGDKICFLQGDDVMEVDVSRGTAPALGTPRKLFTRPALGDLGFGIARGFAMTRDGSRFVIMQPEGGGKTVKGVTVVQSWFKEFREK